MQHKIDNDILQALRALYKSNPVAKRLLDWFASRQKDSTETGVERAAVKAASSYTEMLQVFRLLEDIGVGRFIEGRKGFKSRMVWSRSLRSIGQAARGEVFDLHGIEAALFRQNVGA